MKGKTKTKITGILLLFAAIMAGAYWHLQKMTSEEAAKEKPAIRIGAILPLSGEASLDGISAYNGAKLAIEEINKRPENRYFYEYVVEDDGLNTAKALTIYQKMKSTDDIDALTSMNASFVKAARKLIAGDKMFHISITGDSSVVDNIYNFDQGGEIDSIAHVFADYLEKTELKKISVLYAYHAEMERIAETFLKELRKRDDFLILSTGRFNPADRRFKADMLKIIREKPDAVYLQAQEPALGIIGKELRQMGYKGKIITLHQFARTPNKEVFEGDLFADVGTGSKKFKEKYKKAYKMDPQPAAAASYDNIYLIYRVFEQNGKNVKDYRQALHKAIRGYEGANGYLRIKDGVISIPGVVKTIKNGKVAEIEETE